jgi:hypothetical protein
MATTIYGLEGVSESLEFAKNGLKIKSSGTLFQAYNNAEDTLVALQVADGENDADAVNRGQLDLKQNILTVAAGSENYLDITGDEISVKNLLIHDVTVDVTYSTIAAFCAAMYSSTNDFQEGDVVVLTTASDGSETWIHNGGTAITEADFTEISVNLTDSVIRGLFSAGTGIAYNSSTGEISVDATSDEIADSGSYTNISGSDVAALLASIDSVLSGKQDTLTAGTGIDITGDTISVDADATEITADDTGHTYATGATVDAQLGNLDTALGNITASTFGERHITLQHTDSGNNNIGSTVPADAMITDWYVDVRTTFDDVDATLEAGVSGNANSIFATSQVNLQVAGMYRGDANTSHTMSTTQFIANLFSDGSTQGEVCIVLKYINME